MFEMPSIGELSADFNTIRLALYTDPEDFPLQHRHSNAEEALERIEAYVRELEERDYASWEASLGEDL
jgi:hypothetical protein